MSDFVISSSGLAPKCGRKCATICASRFLADFSGVYVFAVHGPPFSEARNRAFPPVHARADVELDLVGPSLGGLLVREPGGLAIHLTVDHLAEIAMFPRVRTPRLGEKSHVATNQYGSWRPKLSAEIGRVSLHWAVVTCLVGGGQEIHTGEAGIARGWTRWCPASRNGESTCRRT